MEDAQVDTARRRTQKERRELSYKRMLAAAIELFERQGSSRTTLAQVGELSGYSYGLVTHRFGSKAELVRAVTRQLQADFAREALPALDKLSAIAALQKLAETYLRTATSMDANAMYALIGEALGPVPEIRAEMADADRNFRDEIKSRVEQGISSGEIRADIQPAAYAALFVGMLRGIVIQRLLEKNSINALAVSDEVTRNIELHLARRN